MHKIVHHAKFPLYYIEFISNTYTHSRSYAYSNLGYNQLTAVPDGVFQNTPEILYL